MKIVKTTGVLILNSLIFTTSQLPHVFCIRTSYNFYVIDINKFMLKWYKFAQRTKNTQSKTWLNK